LKNNPPFVWWIHFFFLSLLCQGEIKTGRQGERVDSVASL
jgi:hypothetical protein